MTDETSKGGQEEKGSFLPSTPQSEEIVSPPEHTVDTSRTLSEAITDLSTAQQEQDTSRRENLRQLFDLRHREKLEAMMEPLERAVLQNPTMSIKEFQDLLQTYPNINRWQRLAALDAFGRYQQDQQAVRAYVSLLFGEHAQSANVMEAINENEKALTTFLQDAGVQELGTQLNIHDFYIDTKIPSCFIVHYKGRGRKLWSAMRGNLPQNTAAFFLSGELDLSSQEREKLSAQEIQRRTLLQRKVIFLVDDSQSYAEDYEHELRHYLFSLYGREGRYASRESFVDEYILNELHSYYAHGADSNYAINHFIPWEYPSSLGKQEYYLSNDPENAQRLFNVLHELTRLRLAGYTDTKKISLIASTADSLDDFLTRIEAERIERVPQSDSVPEQRILREMVEYAQSSQGGNMDILTSDLYWFRLVLERASFEQLTPAEMTHLMQTLNLRLEEIASGTVGYNTSEGNTTAKNTRQAMQLLTQFGYSIAPMLPPDAQLLIPHMIEMLHAREESRARSRQREQLWNQFVTFLGVSENGEERALAQKYQELSQYTNKQGALAMQQFRKDIEPLFQSWQKNQQSR